MKQEKEAAQQQALRSATFPSWLYVFSLLAISAGLGYGWRALAALSPNHALLHAVPESELVSVNLTVNPDLFSSAIKATGKKVVFGKPAEPIEHPADFVPATAKTIVLATPPPSPPPPASPPPPEGPKTWIVEARRTPQPRNASLAAAAMAAAAAVAREGGEGSYAYEVLDARPGTLLIGGDDAFGEEVPPSPRPTCFPQLPLLPQPQSRPHPRPHPPPHPPPHPRLSPLVCHSHDVLSIYFTIGTATSRD